MMKNKENHSSTWSTKRRPWKWDLKRSASVALCYQYGTRCPGKQRGDSDRWKKQTVSQPTFSGMGQGSTYFCHCLFPVFSMKNIRPFWIDVISDGSKQKTTSAVDPKEQGMGQLAKITSLEVSDGYPDHLVTSFRKIMSRFKICPSKKGWILRTFHSGTRA